MAAMIRSRRWLILLVALILLFVAGDYFLRFQVILPGFAELEQQEAAKDIARCKNAIEREILHVEKISTDWAVWDDLYQYADDGNAAFVESNFQWQTLAATGIHLMYVINTEGKIVYRGAINPSTMKMVDIRQLPSTTFPAPVIISCDSPAMPTVFRESSSPIPVLCSLPRTGF